MRHKCLKFLSGCCRYLECILYRSHLGRNSIGIECNFYLHQRFTCFGRKQQGYKVFRPRLDKSMLDNTHRHHSCSRSQPDSHKYQRYILFHSLDRDRYNWHTQSSCRWGVNIVYRRRFLECRLCHCRQRGSTQDTPRKFRSRLKCRDHPHSCLIYSSSCHHWDG